MEKENIEQAEAKLAAYERSNLQNIIQNEARKVQDSTAPLQHAISQNDYILHCKLPTIEFKSTSDCTGFEHKLWTPARSERSRHRTSEASNKHRTCMGIAQGIIMQLKLCRRCRLRHMQKPRLARQ